MSNDSAVKNTAAASVAVMNQLPAKGDAEMFAQSPLFDSGIHPVSQGAISDNSVALKELKLLGHLVIRANAGDEQLSSSIESVLGAKLPSTLQSVYLEKISIYWVSPDEWLVVCPGDQTYALEKKLRATMSGHFSIVNVSGGQTVLTLSGEYAREILMKSTAYDVSDQNFPVGKAVTSVFAKSQAIICRKSDTTWKLIIRRSFANYIGLWIENACKEYGLAVSDS